MEGKKGIVLEDILDEAKRKNKTIKEDIIKRAYNYANKKHKDQLRKSGEEYIIHPLNVAYILATLGLDTETICAALLHDVVEDTDGTYEEIEKNFGKEIATLVEGVTKLTNLFKTVEEKKTENYKKMFIAMEKDIRVIILKLADRLHNINTLQYLSRDRQIAISQETIDLYAPIAHKLGMYDLKMKLQDGAFKYLYPEEYNKILMLLEEKIEKNTKLLENTKRKIDCNLKNQRIEAITKIETKHIYNIYRKIIEKKIDIDQIKDLFAIKIIANNKQDCYKILGIINNIYHSLPRTFKDYIATPRNNKYQAIHEIMLGEKGVMFEAQICSYRMNKIARYGITNYFSYFENKEKDKNEWIFEKNLEGIHNSLEFENMIENPKEFLGVLKSELLDDEIYIFTPKGEIKVLPKDSTVIDFAYSIHDEIGNHMLSCKINSIEMPVITTLKNGNIVEILTSQEELIPQEEWLELIKTAKAKSRIVKLLDKKEKEVKEKKTIKIVANDRKGLALEISNIFTENKINIESFKTKVEKGKVELEVIVTIDKKYNIINLSEKILKIKDIIFINIL